MKTAALFVPAFVCLALAGCTKDSTVYPSLAPRPIEKLGFAEPEVAAEEARPDPALDARIADLDRTLAAITKGAGSDTAKAEAAAARARGKPVGSDAWLDAQTALAALDDWRAQASSLLTDVDQIASDRAAALAPEYPGLAALRARIATEAERQTATIDRIQSGLPAA